ncbi:MAG: ABC transporter ATP-binding protein, partial [Fischerella thermalis M58_A2018_009]|nr:ABC transporter ATP-binding protein [Fischerella thermalis M58_A2018_009]MBF2061615.1 ABC transporter ATP-binding protein [Fischerella thermalis M66_A2018_004]
LQQLYQRLARQQIVISTLGKQEELLAELKNNPCVQEWEIISVKNSVRVNFSGKQEDCADLLRSLIQANIPVSEFHCTQEDLETIFLKLGHKQAS